MKASEEVTCNSIPEGERVRRLLIQKMANLKNKNVPNGQGKGKHQMQAVCVSEHAAF